MPSFGVYVIRSMQYLAPTLLAMMLLMVADHPAAWAAGGAVVAWIVARGVADIRRSLPAQAAPVGPA